MRKKRKRRKKAVRRLTVFLSVLLVAYLIISIFFTKNFYFASRIKGIKALSKTVTSVKIKLLYELKGYTLTLKERGGKSEQIKAEDIGLKYDSGFKYSSELLKEQVDKLSLFNNSSVEAPKNAALKFTGSTYMIVDEIKGNKINKDILLKSIEDAISKQEKTIDLESAHCYVNPQYTSESKKVIAARDMLNKYISSKITYTFGDHKETLYGSTINKWLSVDADFNVTIDRDKVKAYVESLANTYNTVGRQRSFNTTSGKTINISGGDYGWQMDIDKETDDLMAAIKGGQTVTKEPAYVQKAASYGSSDIGDTYVEIDMTKQHLWFYKNGSLVVEGDVVTGNVSLNDTTPAGIYRLKYKERNATLKGKDYSVPVSFWMPFNGNIGIHDATWRSVFGGEIYKTNGSHGCVNSPYTLAETIYENIDAGTPIVCYY